MRNRNCFNFIIFLVAMLTGCALCHQTENKALKLNEKQNQIHTLALHTNVGKV